MQIRLRRERLEHHLAVCNLNHRMFAGLTGLTSSHLSELMNGKRQPSARVRAKILEVVERKSPHVTFHDLFHVLDSDGNIVTQAPFAVEKELCVLEKS